MGLHYECENWLQTDALAGLPNYNTPRANSKVGCFFSYEVTNFDQRIPLENDKSFTYSDYEVAVVCNSISGRSVRMVIETNKFSCRW